MSPSSLNPFHHSKPTTDAPAETSTPERRRSSLVGLMKKVVHAGEHESDYRRSVEENARGRKGSQEHEDAVAASPDAVAAARAALAEQNLAEPEPRRRNSLSELLRDGARLVKKQEGRGKVAVALS